MILRGILERGAMKELFERRAAHYDVASNLYYLAGFREFAYRREAVDALRLRRGQTVLELGCGTGLNLRFLRAAVGAEGLIIGVDLSPRMLAVARERARRHRWDNVDFVEADAGAWDPPVSVDGVLSTFAITLIHDPGTALRHAAAALRTGGRVALLDVQPPPRWPDWLVRVGSLTSVPFGVTVEVMRRRPWELLPPDLHEVDRRHFYFRIAYLSVSEKR
jgi:demethylmenaquinone methyltransferase/2-methoxy-6-polyprenyl-1,4-benzoquinol methylase